MVVFSSAMLFAPGEMECTGDATMTVMFWVMNCVTLAGSDVVLVSSTVVDDPSVGVVTVAVTSVVLVDVPSVLVSFTCRFFKNITLGKLVTSTLLPPHPVPVNV